jgi:hypothetical protein
MILRQGAWIIATGIVVGIGLALVGSVMPTPCRS